MEAEFFKSRTWLRWLELRKKKYLELDKKERAEYRKLEPVVCSELTKLQPYILPRPPRIRKKGSQPMQKLVLLGAGTPRKDTLPREAEEITLT